MHCVLWHYNFATILALLFILIVIIALHGAVDMWLVKSPIVETLKDGTFGRHSLTLSNCRETGWLNIKLKNQKWQFSSGDRNGCH